MATLLLTSGDFRHVTPQQASWTVAELAELVSGDCEYLRVTTPSGPRVVVVDAQGKVKRLPLNLRASQVTGFSVYGPAVVVPPWETKSIN